MPAGKRTSVLSYEGGRNKYAMIEKIKNFFSNVVILALILALGVTAILFLSSRSQNNQLTTQVSDTKSTATLIVEEATPTSTTEPTEPEDDLPEPTWTPVIVLPDAPQPTTPPRLPTPTPTPVNPNESVLISFDVPAGLGAVSPDGKTLAFNLLQTKTEPSVNPYSQVWLLDLVSKETTKLTEVGAVGLGQDVWSPDGKMLAYHLFSPNGFLEEVRIVGIDGSNDRSLLKNEDLLGYYWINSVQMGLIRASSVDRVDLIGRVVGKKAVNLPAGKTAPADFQPKPKVTGSSQDIVIVLENGSLIVISQNGQTTISDDQGWWINDFELAPDGKQIAYVTSNGPEEAFWVSDLSGNNRDKIFERVGKERGHIGPILWSPDSQAAVLGWSEPGTSQYLTLIWIDVVSGKVTPLEVDGVNFSGLAFSPDGQYLYYDRISFLRNSEWGASTFYQLKVK